MDHDEGLKGPRNAQNSQKSNRIQPQWKPPLDSFQAIFEQVRELQQNPEMVNSQSNYLFGQQRTAPESKKTLLQSVHRGTATSSGTTEQVFVTQNRPILVPSVGAYLGSGPPGTGIPEARRLAQLGLNSINQSQRELIERSLSIGGVSFANDGYNARTNQQRNQNITNGQETFQTPEFFRIDLPFSSKWSDWTLLTFGSREVVANGESNRQQQMEGQSDQMQVDTEKKALQSSSTLETRRGS